jgi:hypothetical protein
MIRALENALGIDYRAAVVGGLLIAIWLICYHYQEKIAKIRHEEQERRYKELKEQRQHLHEVFDKERRRLMGIDEQKP